MSLTLEPAQVFDYANHILCAARAPDGMIGTEATEKERVNHYLGMLEGYEDSSLWICTGFAIDPDGRHGMEITIHLRLDSEDPYETVFIAYRFDDEAAEDGIFVVELYTPGPWCQYLETLVHRADAVLQSRGPDAYEENHP
jgi:hypothetical protein